MNIVWRIVTLWRNKLTGWFFLYILIVFSIHLTFKKRSYMRWGLFDQDILLSKESKFNSFLTNTIMCGKKRGDWLEEGSHQCFKITTSCASQDSLRKRIQISWFRMRRASASAEQDEAEQQEGKRRWQDFPLSFLGLPLPPLEAHYS